MIFRLFGRVIILVSTISLGILSLLVLLAMQVDNQQIFYYSLNDEFAYPGSTTDEHHIYAHDLLWDIRVPLTRDGTQHRSILLTADNSQMLYFSDDCIGQSGLCQMDINGHNKQLLVANVPEQATFGAGARWSPDGTRLAFVTHMPDDIRQPALYVYDRLNNTLQQAPDILYLDWDAPIAWERDSDSLYVVEAQPRSFKGYRWSLRDDALEAVHTWLDTAWNARANVLDVLGTVFLVRARSVSQPSYDLFALDMASGAASNISTTRILSEVEAQFSSDGSQIAVVAGTEARRMLSLIAADTSSWQMLVAPTYEALFSPIWLKDDATLLYRSGSVSGGQGCLIHLTTDDEATCPLVWTPDIIQRP